MDEEARTKDAKQNFGKQQDLNSYIFVSYSYFFYITRVYNINKF